MSALKYLRGEKEIKNRENDKRLVLERFFKGTSKIEN